MQHGSLPIDPSTGRPDYSSIDASPISMVLTSAIRRLLIEEVGVDRVPHIPHRKFEGVLNPVREVNDMKGTARQVQVRAKRVFDVALHVAFLNRHDPIFFTHDRAFKWPRQVDVDVLIP